MNFADNLAALPGIDHLDAVELWDGEQRIARIENRPGSAGSARVYAWLGQRHGGIDAEAAEEGLCLYAEHTEDARAHPGKHPNIDRLLNLGEARLRVAPIPRA